MQIFDSQTLSRSIGEAKTRENPQQKNDSRALELREERETSEKRETIRNATLHKQARTQRKTESTRRHIPNTSKRKQLQTRRVQSRLIQIRERLRSVQRLLLLLLQILFALAVLVR